MNILSDIPPRIRKALYVIYALVGVVLGAFQVADVDSLGPVDLGKTLDVFAYVGIALGLTAASNTPSYADVVEGDAPPPDRGAVGLGTAVVIALLVVLVLVLISVLR